MSICGLSYIFVSIPCLVSFYNMIYLSRLFVELFDSKFEKSFVSLDWLVDETVEGVGKPIKLKKSISSNSMVF